MNLHINNFLQNTIRPLGEKILSLTPIQKIVAAVAVATFLTVTCMTFLAARRRFSAKKINEKDTKTPKPLDPTKVKEIPVDTSNKEAEKETNNNNNEIKPESSDKELKKEETLNSDGTSVETTKEKSITNSEEKSELKITPKEKPVSELSQAQSDLENKKFTEARDAFAEITKNEAKNYEAWHGLSNALEQLGDQSGSAEAMKKAIAYNPERKKELARKDSNLYKDLKRKSINFGKDESTIDKFIENLNVEAPTTGKKHRKPAQAVNTDNMNQLLADLDNLLK